MTKRKYTKSRKPFAPRPAQNRVTRFGLAEGDGVHRGKGTDGLLSPADAEFARQIEAAESILRRYRKAFRELAA